MTIRRDNYLKRLAEKRDNGLVKIVTGVRRSGKSFLLLVLYREYLLASGVSSEQIISLALDNALNAKYRDPIVLSEYLQAQMKENGKRYYVFLDEIQFVGKKKLQRDPDIYVTFYDVLNGLMQTGRVSRSPRRSSGSSSSCCSIPRRCFPNGSSFMNSGASIRRWTTASSRCSSLRSANRSNLSPRSASRR